MEGRFFLKHSGKFDFIKVVEIIVITSIGNYCKIISLKNSNIIVRKTLTRFENILPESHFLRINRSTIINLDYITKITQWSSGRFRIHIKDLTEPLIISQRYANKIKGELMP